MSFVLICNIHINSVLFIDNIRAYYLKQNERKNYLMHISSKAYITILVFITLTGAATGQSLTGNYRTGIGIRAGETSGLTVKFNTQKGSSVELITGIWSDWLSFTGVYEKNVPAFNIDGMRWYYGAGGHVAFQTDKFDFHNGRYYDRGDDFALGIDGIVGLEFKIPPIPFAISIDIKPFLEIYNNGDLFFDFDPGLGVKFTF